MHLMNKHHKVSFSYYFIFNRIMCFDDFLGKRTLCDAYHKELASHNPAFLDISEHVETKEITGKLLKRIKTI